MNKKHIILLLLSILALTVAGIAQDGEWDHEEAENTDDEWDHQEVQNEEEIEEPPEEEWDVAQAERTPAEELEVQEVEPEEEDIERTYAPAEVQEEVDPQNIELEVEPEQVEINESFTVTGNITEEVVVYLEDEEVDETSIEGAFETELTAEEIGEHEIRAEMFGENYTTTVEVIGEPRIETITATEVMEPEQEGIICVTTTEDVPAEISILHEEETIATESTEGAEEVCFTIPPEEETGTYDYTVQLIVDEEPIIERELTIEVEDDAGEQEVAEVDVGEEETEENETEVEENNETEENENNNAEEDPTTEPDDEATGFLAGIIEWFRNLFN